MIRHFLEKDEFFSKLKEWEGKKVDIHQEEPAFFYLTGKLRHVFDLDRYVLFEVDNARFEFYKTNSMRFYSAYDNFSEENYHLIAEYGSCALWINKLGWPFDPEDR